MMKNTISCMLLAVMLLFATACSTDDQAKLIGTWDTGTFFVDGEGVSGFFEPGLAFYENGTCSRDVRFFLDSTEVKFGEILDYSLVDDKIIFTDGGNTIDSWSVKVLKNNELEVEFEKEINGQVRNVTFDFKQ